MLQLSKLGCVFIILVDQQHEMTGYKYKHVFRSLWICISRHLISVHPFVNVMDDKFVSNNTEK